MKILIFFAANLSNTSTFKKNKKYLIGRKNSDKFCQVASKFHASKNKKRAKVAL